jgi:hypothetical protein
MLALPDWFLLVALVALAMAGSATGAVVAALLSVIPGWPRKPRTSWNIALGAIGFVVGFVICGFVPFPRNTIYEALPSGGTVATTTNRYQHPYGVAFATAVVLPVAFEIWRSGRRFSR